MENYNLGGSEQEQIAQRMKYAQLLQQQGMTPINPNVGYRVSPMEGLAKMLQAYVGRKGIDQATEQQGALMQSQKDARGAENEKLAALLGGQSAMPMPTRVDDEGNSNAGLDIAAKAPDQRGALALMMQSQDPQRQQMGIQGMMAKPQGPKWEKFEMPSADGSRKVGFVDVNSPNPISTFQDGGTAPAAMKIAPNGMPYNEFNIDPKQNFGAIKDVNIGGKTLFMKPDGSFQGSIDRTMSPDAKAANALGWSRFNFDK